MNKLYIVIALVFFLSNHSIADSSYDRGKEKSVTCSACHGSDGNSNNKMYPRLAGQYKNYLSNALHAYRSGERKNAVMAGFASGLTDQDIEDLSEYFSKQTGLEVLPNN